MGSTASGFVLIALGVLVMLGAAMNWRIVNRSGKLINRLLGDTVARVIYFGVGIFVFVKGIELTIGAH
jgi:Na+/H+ antiporter NhaD/arsenite permease-like protein